MVAEVKAQARELRRITAKTLEEIQRLARGLHPLVLDDLGLEAALRGLAKEFAQTYRLDVDVHMSGLSHLRFPREVEWALFRIAQEAFTNIVKHAHADHVSLLVRCGPSDVKMIVEDDGRGFDPEKILRSQTAKGHLGLPGMRERAALLNGNFSMESTPGKGTTIYVQVPPAEDAGR